MDTDDLVAFQKELETMLKGFQLAAVGQLQRDAYWNALRHLPFWRVKAGLLAAGKLGAANPQRSDAIPSTARVVDLADAAQLPPERALPAAPEKPIVYPTEDELAEIRRWARGLGRGPMRGVALSVSGLPAGETKR